MQFSAVVAGEIEETPQTAIACTKKRRGIRGTRRFKNINFTSSRYSKIIETNAKLIIFFLLWYFLKIHSLFNCATLGIILN